MTMMWGGLQIQDYREMAFIKYRILRPALFFILDYLDHKRG